MSDTDETTQPELPAIGFAERTWQRMNETLLGSFGEFVTANDGDLIINEGEEQNSLLLIVFGSFHVQTDTTGRTVLLGQLRSGDSIGEINIFDPGAMPAPTCRREVAFPGLENRPVPPRTVSSRPIPAAAARLLVSCRHPAQQAPPKNQRERSRWPGKRCWIPSSRLLRNGLSPCILLPLSDRLCAPS